MLYEVITAKAELAAEERVLTALVGASASPTTRESFRKKLREGDLDDKEIEIEVRDTGGGMPSFDIPGMQGPLPCPIAGTQDGAGSAPRPGPGVAEPEGGEEMEFGP